MSRRKNAYYRYLESGHWKSLRKAAFERDGFKCHHCGSSRFLRGHHKRYRKDLRLCTVDDIETLCDSCHRKHHREQKRLRRANRKPRKIKLCALIKRFSAEDAFCPALSALSP